MKIKVEHCWCGGNKYVFRANICGGLCVPTTTCKWDRKTAKKMLDLIEIQTPHKRENIRFIVR